MIDLLGGQGWILVYVVCNEWLWVDEGYLLLVGDFNWGFFDGGWFIICLRRENGSSLIFGIRLVSLGVSIVWTLQCLRSCEFEPSSLLWRADIPTLWQDNKKVSWGAFCFHVQVVYWKKPQVQWIVSSEVEISGGIYYSCNFTIYTAHCQGIGKCNIFHLCL